MQLQEQIRNFILANLVVFDDEVEFSDDDNIFELGFVNSLFAMKLVTFIESEFQLTIESDEMEISNFNTINNIVNFIQSKSVYK
ncbi:MULTISPECIES: acyl carrier protein [Brevibacillus]|jgi:methoxymalonate biosynthesis acyl carrier protein|uniref:Carrier domain-containing protein n=1 Tax=Brevibacillus parabrevis TaxID=54914 RepID=A0A4Y3PLK7_BREPA|nr:MULTISPECIES: acyl carrier protein [Brevibacillus]MBU8711019.1 acyl carrier protein [Brevibacillus parabrevis]MDH6353285.1 methoxymalonate biosynthesis acyl carrier protein [Brevibacillus sp. 1238]MDR5002774.1 acyl carrier protein [Brevibacillus parabrevis]MED1721285.1 acyl carrier protein [Brevibacillus parabrevis]MED2253690.1 acyl carrier protein [Brevibacillus parabrevis]